MKQHILWDKNWYGLRNKFLKQAFYHPSYMTISKNSLGKHHIKTKGRVFS